MNVPLRRDAERRGAGVGLMTIATQDFQCMLYTSYTIMF